MDHLVTLYIDQLTVLYLCWACWSSRELVECNMQYECQECPMCHVYMHDEPHCASMHPKIESTFYVSCILYVYALQHTSPGVAVHLPTPCWQTLRGLSAWRGQPIMGNPLLLRYAS